MFPSLTNIRSLVLLACFACNLALRAQTSEYSSSSLPVAPSARLTTATRQPAPKAKPTQDGAYEHFMRGAVSCGGAFGLQDGAMAGRFGMCGASFTFLPAVTTEIGVIGPLNNPAHFYVSEDFVAPITRTIKRLHGVPLGLVGYTKIVSNSNRFDFGVGWDHHLGNGSSLAFEARDYWQSSNSVPHIVMFRLSLASGGDWAD